MRHQEAPGGAVAVTSGVCLPRAAQAAAFCSCFSIRIDLPRLLGVTVLTSLEGADLQRLGQSGEPQDIAAKLASVVQESGCDGVVASVHETASIKHECGTDFLVVTPGIRPAGASEDDQARVATVSSAVDAGSNFLVVGRPIIRAPDPGIAAAEIRAQIEKAYDAR